jgi:mRNA interferase HigB
MRIIKESRLLEFAKQHSGTSASLRNWRTLTRHATWQSFNDIKDTFNSADQITLPDGNRVVFNIRGNAFRLITVVHYNRGIIYIRRLLTHPEYSKGDWRNDP